MINFNSKPTDKKPDSKFTKSKNNGGDTDYYNIPKKAKTVQDLIELFDFNFAQGNIFKAAYTLNRGRHSGTSYERELNKIIWFCQRELNRVHNKE